MFNIHNSIIEFLISETKTIQKISAPSFFENQRATYVKNRLETITGKQATIDKAGNVYLSLNDFKAQKSQFVISAHLDTVFPLSTDLSITETEKSIHGPGIGDNSLGVAMLLTIASVFSTHPNLNSAPITLLANVCEEGLGDLKGMRYFIDQYKNTIKNCIILEGFGNGTIIHRGLGVKRYRISCTTQGGHSWGNAGAQSAIQVIADIVSELYQIDLPKKPKTSLNVGVIEGGVSINTIAPSAHFDLDLRSTSLIELENLENNVIKLYKKYKDKKDIELSIETIGNRPPGELEATHPLIQKAIKAYQKNGVETTLHIASTDANIPLAQGIPAICIGITQGRHAHTMEEMIYLDPIPQGVLSIFSLLEELLR